MNDKASYRAGDFRDREGERWAGSVLESRDGEPYRIHIPWLSREANDLKNALEEGDAGAIRALRYSSQRL
jgi:hypothetical protein